MTFVGIGQGFSNFFLATQISASKSYATQTEENANLLKLVRGVSLLSFTELIAIWGYLGYVFDPHSANGFRCGLFTMVSLFLYFIFGGHGKARDPNLKPARPKFGSRPII